MKEAYGTETPKVQSEKNDTLDLSKKNQESNKKFEAEAEKKRPRPQDPPLEITEKKLKEALKTVQDEKPNSPKEEQTAKPQEPKSWYRRIGGYLAQQGQKLADRTKEWAKDLLGLKTAIKEESSSAPQTIKDQLKSAVANSESQSLSPKISVETSRDDIIAHHEAQIRDKLKEDGASQNKEQIAEHFTESSSFDLKEIIEKNSYIRAFVDNYDVKSSDEDQSKKWEDINPQIAELIKLFTADGSLYAEKLKQLKIKHLDVEIKATLGKKAVQLIIAEIVEKKKGDANQIKEHSTRAKLKEFKIDEKKIGRSAELASAEVAKIMPEKSEQEIKAASLQSAQEINIRLAEKIQRHSAKVKNIQERYKLSDEDIAIDPLDPASLRAFKQRHKELQDVEYTEIILALKQFQQAENEARNEEQIQKLIEERTKGLLQGKSEIEMAKSEDELNYDAYKESYDTIDQYAKAYEYLTQENKQELTKEQVLIIVKTVEGDAKANEFSETVQSLEQSGAHLSNLHYENGQIQGELHTDWGVERKFGYSADKGTIQIPDPNADLKYHEIAPSSENFKQVILLINVDQAMFEASKERSQQEISESRISDQELLNLSSQIKFNLLTNERERINFFSNFLALIRDNNEDKNDAIYRGVDRKLFTLQRILLDPSKNRQFTNLIKLEDYRQFKPQSFTEHMRSHDLLPK